MVYGGAPFPLLFISEQRSIAISESSLYDLKRNIEGSTMNNSSESKNVTRVSLVSKIFVDIAALIEKPCNISDFS